MLVLTAIALTAMQTPEATMPASIYDFTVTNIDGKDVKLKKFKGKVMLIVNVASKCGNTPQYANLESLYAKYKAKGFVVLGFPANNFGHQEPGTNAEIKEFCSATYKVDFPMFSKISVKGDDTAPLYKWLIAHSSAPTQDIQWNFEKFLIGRDGKEIKRIAPRTFPDTADNVADIEAALAG